MEDILDLMSNIDESIFDLVHTMKELVVDDAQYKHRHALEDVFVPASIRDLGGHMINRVLGSVELQVVDALSNVTRQVAGTTKGCQDSMDYLLTTVENSVQREWYLLKRERDYVNKRVAVWCTTEQGARYQNYGTCTSIYDTSHDVYHEPQPGSGLIYCDTSNVVFGYEDTCKFSTELAAGYHLLLPKLDGSGMEERTIRVVHSDYQFELEFPFSPQVLPMNWSKQWGFKNPFDIVETAQVEACDVTFDDGKAEQGCLLSRVELLQQDSESESGTSNDDNETQGDGVESDHSDWEEFFDSDEEAPYWYNKIKKISTWEKPQLDKTSRS